VIRHEQRCGAHAPPLRRKKHTPAALSLKGQGWSLVVDEAADLLLEVCALTPEANIHEGRPAPIQVLHHPGELLLILNLGEKLSDEAGAVLNRGTGRPVLQELGFTPFLDPPLH
jgi:hypothetical protein